MKTKTIKKICYLAMLTALYVVLSAFVKVNVIGNIQLDIGYIAFAFALCKFGVAGATVGVCGCAIESILFTAYGFSISWAVANLIIGVICGLIFSKRSGVIIRLVTVVVSAFIGLLIAKTIIECILYSIPLAVKIPKNLVAFALDSAVMIAGVLIYPRLGGKQ